MNNILFIPPSKFEEDLRDIDLHFSGNYSAEFLNIPPMVEMFWELIHGNAEEIWQEDSDTKIIPTQDEFVQAYMDKHSQRFDSFSDNKQEGIKARVLKTYPSLIRESHFIAQVQQIIVRDDIPCTLLIANSSLDLGLGVDLGVQLNGHSFAIRITKTDSNTDWEEIKRERKSDISTPSSITVIASDATTFSIGDPDGEQLFVFKREVVKHTLEKCWETTKHA